MLEGNDEIHVITGVRHSLFAFWSDRGKPGTRFEELPDIFQASSFVDANVDKTAVCPATVTSALRL